MDEAGRLMAKIQSSMVVPFMYKMIHTGALPKFMQKKLNKTDEGKKELYNRFLNMFGIGKGGRSTVVINIACGLDTRCYRMKGKYLHWYNVDLPETMKIRKQFLTEN